ncbi:MAG: hypothetical protein GW795_15300 [Cyanobacteria bacterium]|nr:hypothetical protein [Cyanobacteria bacterium CG_2015-16_32_12]NCO77026.1 hypothetical protein [Cyanobacteria bacterium CG_2015-22_32_23]NCQ04661.1 hypothetical protein [Cyanobacteria bacterium CG_2015-09_32_10]NCQ43192.1 hypothetical protein [Cyanobacteria bacterium CG_2015-04_32_10]NCS85223.1 hypothetical protein [Cyanobacteria bacterium CG_2015-02_32_10]
MFKSTQLKNKTSKKIVALTLSFSTILSLAPINPLLAKSNPQSRYNSSQSSSILIADKDKQNYQSPNRNYYNRPSNNNNFNWNNNNNNSNWNNNNSNNNNPNNRNSSSNIALNSGTVIATTLPSANKILVTKEETMALGLVVKNDVRDNSNQIIIPAGSQIIGEIRPAGQGSRFFAKTLILRNGNEYPLNATSRIVTRTETISAGKNTDAIWQGALAGAAAGTLLGGITGDKAIATEEVLGGAGFGALAGLLLGGNRNKELISINPEQDLQLTLTSNFKIN